MTDKFWDFTEDLLDYSGAWIGVLMGFILPLIAIGLSVWVLTQ